jgi:hypothetical protein
VVGHRDLYSTDCPGDRLYQLVKAGTFTHPSAPGGDDMPLTDAEIDKVALRCRDRWLEINWGGTPIGSVISAIWQSTSNTDTAVQALRQGAPAAWTQSQVDALASAVVDRIGPQLADQLAQSIATRIANG